jgi:hypothetical protein
MSVREYFSALFSREGWRALGEFLTPLFFWRLFGNRDDW